MSKTRDEKSELPLHGKRVLDFSQYAAAPYAATLLGDFGADVIKIEQPAGDPFRRLDDVFGVDESAYFFGLHRSKRNLRLDLSKPEAAPILARLLETADIVIVGFRPDALDRLGLTYEAVSARNPRVVYCSLTAFGEDGPRSEQPGMDLLAQAISGVMGMTGEVGQPPVKVGPPIADFVGSFLLTTAALCALRVADRDGVGQHVSINLLDGQLAIMPNYITPYLRTKVPFQPVGGGHPQIVPYQVFLAEDKYMVVACPSDRLWRPLCAAIGKPEWRTDERFATNVSRVRHRQEVVGELAALFATKPAQHWLDLLQAHGVPCGPVNSLADALEDEQVVHNRMIVELEHPRHGRYAVVDNPMRLSRTPAQPRGYAADPGEHSSEILGELGFDGGEIERFADRRVAY